MNITQLTLPLVAMMLPLVAAPSRMLGVAPWIAVVAWWIVLTSQPRLGASEMVRDRKDRGSALFIYVATLAGQLVAVMDYGYGSAVRSAGVALAGGAIVCAGLALRLWSIRTLGRFFTSTVQVQDAQTVVSDGPYRLLRHPSYTGALLIGIGVATALGSVVGLAATVALVVPAYLYRIKVEETTLIAELGAAYRTYRTHTWRLVPLAF